MKRIVLYTFAIVLSFSAISCTSGHYVSARPEMMRYNRPAAPYPNAIWIEGGYMWRGGRYLYHPGYWAAPRQGRIYSPGRWANTPRGYYWHRGGWRR